MNALPPVVINTMPVPATPVTSSTDSDSAQSVSFREVMEQTGGASSQQPASKTETPVVKQNQDNRNLVKNEDSSAASDVAESGLSAVPTLKSLVSSGAMIEAKAQSQQSHNKKSKTGDDQAQIKVSSSMQGQTMADTSSGLLYLYGADTPAVPVQGISWKLSSDSLRSPRKISALDDTTSVSQENVPKFSLGSNLYSTSKDEIKTGQGLDEAHTLTAKTDVPLSASNGFPNTESTLASAVPILTSNVVHSTKTESALSASTSVGKVLEATNQGAPANSVGVSNVLEGSGDSSPNFKSIRDLNLLQPELIDRDVQAAQVSAALQEVVNPVAALHFSAPQSGSVKDVEDKEQSIGSSGTFLNAETVNLTSTNSQDQPALPIESDIRGDGIFAKNPFQAMDSTYTETPGAHIFSASQREVSVGVNDPDLGWLEIRTQAVGGAVNATLSTSSSHTANILNSSLGAMEQYVREKDTSVQSIHISDQSPLRSTSGSSGGETGGNGSQGSFGSAGGSTPTEDVISTSAEEEVGESSRLSLMA